MNTEKSDSPNVPQVGSKIMAARWLRVGDWMSVGYDAWKRVDSLAEVVVDEVWPEIIVKFQDGTTETHNELSMCNVKRPR